MVQGGPLYTIVLNRAGTPINSQGMPRINWFAWGSPLYRKWSQFTLLISSRGPPCTVDRFVRKSGFLAPGQGWC